MWPVGHIRYLFLTASHKTKNPLLLEEGSWENQLNFVIHYIPLIYHIVNII